MSSSSTDNAFVATGGSWDEPGLIQSLDKKGFTPNKCSSELIANSNDAQATTIIWKVDSAHIKLIDDGIGMDRDGLQNMFKMFRANNKGKKTMGVSGLGGKEGIYILSKKSNKEPTTVIIYTHTDGGEYLKAIVPWKKIIEEQLYTGQITFANMTAEETSNFRDDLHLCKFSHGTIIVFEYNDALKDLIETQFDVNKMCKMKLDSNNRWDMIFGHTSSMIVLEKTDGTPTKTVGKYNYFDGNELDFYTGKSVDIIHHFIDDKNDDRYILINDANNPNEILPYGKNGFRNDPVVVRIHQTWKLIGTYEIWNGFRTDKRIFDPQNPVRFSTAETILNSYDYQFFPERDAEYVKEVLSGCYIYRNGQLITKVDFDDKKFNSKTSRGNSDSMLNKFHHRTHITYRTESSQDNRMDISMGIQENKNQNQNELPKPLERLIIHTKKDHLYKIDAYFNQVIETKEKKKRELAEQQKQQKKQQQEEQKEEQQQIKKEEEEEDSEEEEDEEDEEEEDEEDEKKTVDNLVVNLVDKEPLESTESVMQKVIDLLHEKFNNKADLEIIYQYLLKQQL